MRARDMKRPGDENAESFAGIVAEPAAFEAVVQAEFQTILRTLGNNGDIWFESVEMLPLLRQSHFAVPDDDAHRRDRKATIKINAHWKAGKRDFSLRRPACLSR